MNVMSLDIFVNLSIFISFKIQDTRYKIQDILLSFCAYNYTHIRQSIQEHNIHKYTIQTQKLQILYKLNCFAVPDRHIQKYI